MRIWRLLDDDPMFRQPAAFARGQSPDTAMQIFPVAQATASGAAAGPQTASNPASRAQVEAQLR